MVVQVFVINRHGARYPLKKPEHNLLWPSENVFWKHNAGKLSPVGVIQMYNLGSFFRKRYPWVNSRNTTIYSTHKSRALESAWSLVLGLLPGVPIKYNPLKIYKNCTDNLCCGIDICCINYYNKYDDPIFGERSMSQAYKFNINESPILNGLTQCPITVNLINRLTNKGYFRLRRDLVTTISKLKDLYSQLQIDSQLFLPDKGTLIDKYELSPEELNIIDKVGGEVHQRYSIPSTDSLDDDLLNKEQGAGILSLISTIMNTITESLFTVFSCHDTNVVAVMSVLGIKIHPPHFSGYILIERTITENTAPDTSKNNDHIAFYYCPEPFDALELEPKVWTTQHSYVPYDTLACGIWDTPTFLSVLAKI